MTTHKFQQLEQDSGRFADGGISMKEENTIIEKYPNKLKIPYDNPGWQEEFDFRRAASLSGDERYVEWRRNE
jgi:hypothetical protein